MKPIERCKRTNLTKPECSCVDCIKVHIAHYGPSSLKNCSEPTRKAYGGTD